MGESDTIFALSSGAGRSGIAVVRVSGPRTAYALSELVGKLPEPRWFSPCVLRRGKSREAIDQGVVVWLPGPVTVTGEDMGELHVHGSEAVLAALTKELGAMEGLRLAEAGEFTKRAFVNGKMDLVEVEGLGGLLEARTEAQRRLAVHHLLGGASGVLEGWRHGLIEVLALVDAVVEFSEEGDVARGGTPQWSAPVQRLKREMTEALDRAERAQVLRRGATVVLAGYPNVGKSSLLNALARREAAIVTATPGTTRDIVEVQLDLGGVPVVVMDTAGLREGSGDEIEMIGMGRARHAAREADVLVWLWSRDVPGSSAVSAGVFPSLVVETKADLPSVRQPYSGLCLSVRSGEGMAGFVARLTELIRHVTAGGEAAVVSEARQIAALRESIRFLNDAASRASEQLELVSADLRSAADAIGRITGRVDVEEWLDAIFGKFCIGK